MIVLSRNLLQLGKNKQLWKKLKKFFPQFQRWILRQPIHQILQMRYQNKPGRLVLDLIDQNLEKMVNEAQIWTLKYSHQSKSFVLHPFYFFYLTFFAPLALMPRSMDLQKFWLNLFCRKEQELSGVYFRFFIAQKMKELHWFLWNF